MTSSSLIHMKLFMTGQEKGDLLIQLTTWAGLIILSLCVNLVCIFWGVIYLVLIRKFPHSLHLYKEQNLKFLGHKIMVYQLNWDIVHKNSLQVTCTCMYKFDFNLLRNYFASIGLTSTCLHFFFTALRGITLEILENNLGFWTWLRYSP